MELPIIGNKKTILIVVLILIVVGIIVYVAYIQKLGQVQSVTDQTGATTSVEVSKNTGVQQLVPVESKVASSPLEFLKDMTGATSTTGTILVKPTNGQIVQPIK